MSHATCYVHMIVAPALGDLGERHPGRFGANRFYTRQQHVGGAKDSNDTACTFFDVLHGSRTTDIQPPIFRTGYDINGIIPGSTPFAQAACFDPSPALAQVVNAAPAEERVESSPSIFLGEGEVPVSLYESPAGGPADEIPAGDINEPSPKC